MSDREDKIEREVLAHKLIAGTATQSERDNALATILLSLWTFEDLRRAFESWHTDKCAECPAKKHADKAEKERPVAAPRAQTGNGIPARLQAKRAAISARPAVREVNATFAPGGKVLKVEEKQ